MFEEIKTMLVEKPVNCLSCDHELKVGDTVYSDEYRNDMACQYCIDDYKKEIMSIEGVDGIYLR